MAADTDTEHDAEHGHGNHPSPGQYVEIGVILAVVTAVEVALFFADIPRQVTVPSLLALTAVKFVLVALWFMHLRFDAKLLRRLFYGGLALAAVIYSVVLAITLL
ncbi:MAG: cytochrome C oxidase subunit IV family protein [Egibacteraceae bacterium]